MSETKEVSPEVLALSAEIAKSLKGVKIETDGSFKLSRDVYLANLPDGVSEATLKNVTNYNKKFIPAVVKAVGELGIAHLAKHNSLDKVSASTSINHGDKMLIDVQRRAEHRNPATAESTTVHGAVSVKVKTAGASNATDMTLIKASLKAMGEKALA